MATIAVPTPAPHASSAFGWLAVGIVLSQVDLRLNGFDLLPDLVGYLIIAVAASRLRPTHHAFGLAAVGALAIAPVSLAALSPHAAGVSSKTGSPVLDALLALADVVILWSTCTGVIGAAAGADHAYLAVAARRRRALVVGVAVVWLFSPALGPALARLPIGLAASMLIVYAAVAVGSLLLLVGLLRRAGRSLGGAAVAAG